MQTLNITDTNYNWDFGKNDNFELKELPNNQAKITNLLGGFSITAPTTYTLIGTSENLSMSYKGPENGTDGPPPVDFATLHFRVHDLETETLLETVNIEFSQFTENSDVKITNNEPKETYVGDFKAYHFDCPFLVQQECYYAELPSYSNKYLFVLKSFSDDFSNGYSQQMNEIMSTVTISN